ncbi:MAG: hypothetical protein Q4E92_05745 [Jeotgalicoccus sp.]|nr:hypothetical protein [Jeotgalicoccus sp.]
MARIETFINENDLIERIHSLRMNEDITNRQLLVLSNDKFENTELNDGSIEVQSIDGTLRDKAVAYLSIFITDEPENGLIEELDLTKEQEDVYRHAIEHHQSVLYIHSRDLSGVHKAELKDMPYDKGTEVIDMNKVNDDGTRL